MVTSKHSIELYRFTTVADKEANQVIVNIEVYKYKLRVDQGCKDSNCSIVTLEVLRLCGRYQCEVG